ncbi:MAG: ribonuclease Z [Aristaeellaceae bacterium]
MVQVTLIGTAATMPLPDRALAAAAVGAQGRRILLDCGEGTQTAARRARVSLLKIDLIALTHYHGDHIFGLPGLLQTMGSLGRTEAVTITGPEGLEAAMTPILALAGELPYEVRLTTLPPEGLALHALHPAWPREARLFPVPTLHRVVSQGYRLTLDRPGRFQAECARQLGLPRPLWGTLQHGQPVAWGGRTIDPSEVLGPARRGVTVVYTGDTMPCDPLAQAAADADLLICEATYALEEQAEQAAAYGHMTFAQAGALAARAGVRRLWLTHYSAMIADPQEEAFRAREHYPGAVCGTDGMGEELSFQG